MQRTDIPNDVMNVILSYLPGSMLLNVTAVCRTWYALIENQRTWTIQNGGTLLTSNIWQFRDRIIKLQLPTFMSHYIFDQKSKNVNDTMLFELFNRLALSQEERFDIIKKQCSGELLRLINLYEQTLKKQLASSVTTAAFCLQLLPDISQMTTNDIDEARNVWNTILELVSDARCSGKFSSGTDYSVETTYCEPPTLKRKRYGLNALTNNLLTFNQSLQLMDNDAKFQSRLQLLLNQDDFEVLILLNEKKIIEKATALSYAAVSSLVTNSFSHDILENDLLTIDEAEKLTGGKLGYLSNEAGMKALQGKLTCMSRDTLLGLDEKLIRILFQFEGIYPVEDRIVTIGQITQKCELLCDMVDHGSRTNVPIIENLWIALREGLLEWNDVVEPYFQASSYNNNNITALLFSAGGMTALRSKLITVAKIRDILAVLHEEGMSFLRAICAPNGYKFLTILMENEIAHTKPEENTNKTKNVSVVPSSVFASQAPLQTGTTSDICIINQSFELF